MAKPPWQAALLVTILACVGIAIMAIAQEGPGVVEDGNGLDSTGGITSEESIKLQSAVSPAQLQQQVPAALFVASPHVASKHAATTVLAEETVEQDDVVDDLLS